MPYPQLFYPSIHICPHHSIHIPFFTNPPTQQEGSVLPGQLLKPQAPASPPDMSPFFLRQYVKGHASDVFEDYPQLITEVVLRLPYQVK